LLLTSIQISGSAGRILRVDVWHIPNSVYCRLADVIWADNLADRGWFDGVLVNSSASDEFFFVPVGVHRR